nr:MAG TPA: hypothetical protein [Caudoviricetes sp.]
MYISFLCKIRICPSYWTMIQPRKRIPKTGGP